MALARMPAYAGARGGLEVRQPARARAYSKCNIKQINVRRDRMRQAPFLDLNLWHRTGTKKVQLELEAAPRESRRHEAEPRTPIYPRDTLELGTPIDRPRSTAPISNTLSGGDEPL